MGTYFRSLFTVEGDIAVIKKFIDENIKTDGSEEIDFSRVKSLPKNLKEDEKLYEAEERIWGCMDYFEEFGPWTINEEGYALAEFVTKSWVPELWAVEAAKFYPSLVFGLQSVFGVDDEEPIMAITDVYGRKKEDTYITQGWELPKYERSFSFAIHELSVLGKSELTESEVFEAISNLKPEESLYVKTVLKDCYGDWDYRAEGLEDILNIENFKNYLDELYETLESLDQ